jgi:hypothetical protein
VFCPACGTQLPESAKFCLECGVKLASFAPGIGPDAAGANKTAPIGSAVAAVVQRLGGGDGLAGEHGGQRGAGVCVDGAERCGDAARDGRARVAAAPSAVRASKTGTTAHGAQVFVDVGDDRVEVPMTGPSRKTIALGAVAIALVSVSVGAVGAWRAVKASRPQTTVAPPLQESTVALLETPHSVPRETDVGPQRGAGGRARRLERPAKRHVERR